MFVKVCKRKRNNKTYRYLQIAQSYRENGKVKHRVIANLGHLKESDINSLIKGFNRVKEQPASLAEAEMKCKKVLAFGELRVLDFLWNKLRLSETIDRLQATHLPNVQFSISPYVKLMTFYRLLRPGSELQLAEDFPDLYFPDIQKLEYHKLIRSLAYVLEIKNDLEARLFERQKDLFHLNVDLVFYDITSTYFESSGPRPLARKGYSRDKRPDRDQVIIVLAITQDGFPIGHEVLPGNLQDGKTVKDMIKNLKERFEIDKCIFVGDRGMVSAENIRYIQEQGYRYIFALKRRGLRETAAVLEPDLGKYKTIHEYDDEGLARELKYMEKEHDGVRYLVCHNPARAVEERGKLEKKKARLAQKVAEIMASKHTRADKKLKRLSRLSGIERFYTLGLTETGELRCAFNHEADRYEQLIAGKFVLKTNEPSLKAESIISAYKKLSGIEAAFKDMKSFLGMRPIYHQKKETTRGHILVVVLAYLLQCVLERYINLREAPKITASRALRELSRAKLVVNEINNYRFGTLTELGPAIKTILKRTGMKKFEKTYYLEKKEVVLPKKTIEKLKKYEL